MAADLNSDGSTRSKRQAYYDAFYPYTIWENGVDYSFEPSVSEYSESVSGNVLSYC